MKHTVIVVVVVLILGIAFVLLYRTRSTAPIVDSYSTVVLVPVDILQLLKELSAEPIGLQIDHLPEEF